MPDGSEIETNLPFYFKKEIETTKPKGVDFVFGKIDTAVITLVECSGMWSATFRSILYVHDKFPLWRLRLYCGDPFKDCEEIKQSEFDSLVTETLKRLKL